MEEGIGKNAGENQFDFPCPPADLDRLDSARQQTCGISLGSTFGQQTMNHQRYLVRFVDMNCFHSDLAAAEQFRHTNIAGDRLREGDLIGIH